MFRCQITGEVSKPKQPEIRVVIDERPVTYTNWRRIDDPRDPRGRNPRYIEHITVGTEIVTELRVTPEGLAALDRNGMSYRRV